MNCRHCQSPLSHRFLDLGFAPPSNAYLNLGALNRPEKHYPLRVWVCETCWLVQTEDHAQADELFSTDYAYFSSTSSSWLAHAAQYAAHITQRLSLGAKSLVVEIASNDGYLLQNFVAAGIPCLGIEPTLSTAQAARALGIEVITEFFGTQMGATLAAQGRTADLVIGNNVYAHVPDINDFTAGLALLLKPGGTVTLEFPHLLQLLRHTQFDTIYHEHFSYFSLRTVSRIFAAAGLQIFDVEQLGTHGGSLRVYGCHQAAQRPQSSQVAEVLTEEAEEAMEALPTYLDFQRRTDKTKQDLLRFLLEQKARGKRVAAYGAAAKGNTLLNYAGVRPDLLSFVADAASSKQGKFMPGSHLPILPPSALSRERVDVVLILPWNIAPEVLEQNRALLAEGLEFFTAVPEIRRVG